MDVIDGCDSISYRGFHKWWYLQIIIHLGLGLSMNQPSIFGVPPFMETRNNAIYEKPHLLMVIELDVMNQYDIAF